MSRICTLSLTLRHFAIKNVMVNSCHRNLSSSSRLTQHLTLKTHSEFRNSSSSFICHRAGSRTFLVPTISTGYSWRGYAEQNKNNNNKPASAGDDDPLCEDDAFEVFSETDSDDDTLVSGKKSDVPATNTVPDFFPIVPLVATSFPIFPKFTKIFQVTDPKLIKLLEYKLDMKQPYIGIFVRKSQEDISSVAEVKNLDEVHSIGAFAKISEINKTDGKLVFLATAHRRIELERQLKHERTANPETDKKKRKHLKEIQNILRQPESNVLMVQVKNLIEEKVDSNSPEYKALTMEIVKTIRDIIMSNSLIRDNLEQLLGNNLRVNDNPSYLADLAASITSSKADELQEVLSEKNVMSRMRMSLDLLMKEKQLLELQKKIGKEVETKIMEQQRVFMLREQMKAIKRELGLEKDDKEALAEKYRKLLEGKVVPKAAQIVIDEELEKLGFLDNNSAEFT